MCCMVSLFCYFMSVNDFTGIALFAGVLGVVLFAPKKCCTKKHANCGGKHEKHWFRDEDSIGSMITSAAPTILKSSDGNNNTRIASVQQWVNTIQRQTTISLNGSNGNVFQMEATDFLNGASGVIECPSKYNPTYFRTVATKVGSRYAAIANITFDRTTNVQFVAVDGSKLSKTEFESRPATVIQKYNSRQLPIITFGTDLKLSEEEKAMMDAYSGCIWYCMFMYKALQVKGIIDKSHVFLCVVNTNQANCFWNGAYMTFGNNNTSTRIHWTSVDVCGHECGHSLVSVTADLEYEGESGALNESIADMMGTSLEKFIDVSLGKNRFDYDIAEDFRKLRSMSGPNSFGNAQRYQQRFYWVDPSDTSDENDYGGVHSNSGVGNFLFFIMTNDGKKIKTPTRNGTLSVRIAKPFPMNTFSKLIFVSMKGGDGYKQFPSTCTYKQFAACLRANCRQFLTREGIKDVDVYVASLDAGLKGVGL